MAIHLHVNNKNLDDQKESELHFMPCKIQGDEAAKVSSFFKPYIHKVDEECEYNQIQKISLELFYSNIQLKMQICEN